MPKNLTIESREPSVSEIASAIVCRMKPVLASSRIGKLSHCATVNATV